MPRGLLTPEQKARHGAAMAVLRADPAFEARRLAALASPETRAKMRAAKLGRPQSPETRAKRAAAQTGKPLSPEHRQRISAAQKGRPLTTDHRLALTAGHRTPEARAHMSAAQQHRTDAQKAALAAWNRKPRGAMTQAHKDAIGDGHARAYAEGRRSYSTLERRASWLLLPLGYVPFQRIGGHIFDFASADGQTVIEVNGCRWHDHRRIKPSCPTTPREGTFERDEAYRAIVRARRMRLVELWSCDEASWPRLLGITGLG